MLFKAGLSFLLISIFFLADLSAISSNINLYAQTKPGASLFIQPAPAPLITGTVFTVPLRLSTGDNPVYSVQADLTYPTNLLNLEGIDSSSSSFQLKVVETGSNGQISIIRGSFAPVNGENILIANLKFKALASGNALIKFQPTSVVPKDNANILTSSPELAISISNPPAASGSTIKIYAAGTHAKNIFPTLRLDLKSSTGTWKSTKTFTNINGDANTGTFKEYLYKSPLKIIPSSVRIRFTNDAYLPAKNQDRNLRVDKINIDGIDYQTESDTTYSQGSWSSLNGCSAGFKKSEWLHCSGYFEFK